MSDQDRFQLLFGPYEPPKIPSGGTLLCEMRGHLRVGRWSDAPIPWPKRWRANSLILCGDLVRAVQQESVDAVSYHWGVCRNVVQQWRKALAVKESTPGTSHYRKWARAHGSADFRKRGIARAQDPFLGIPPGMVARRRRKLGIQYTGAVFARWTPREESLIGTRSDEEVGRIVGRTADAVKQRRKALRRHLNPTRTAPPALGGGP